MQNAMADRQMTDPLGRQITLTERTWYEHIVEGHPEIARHQALVEAAIADPLVIRLSRSDPDCRLYFGRGPRQGVTMLVVADVRRGMVKTAHLARRQFGGATEWPS